MSTKNACFPFLLMQSAEILVIISPPMVNLGNFGFKPHCNRKKLKRQFLNFMTTFLLIFLVV